MKKTGKMVVVSGGFDPIHIGHVRMMFEAKALGDELVVVLNNDNWVRKKKGSAFMPEDERKEIIEALKPVDKVVITKHTPDDDDVTICDALRELKPSIFANGGDRKKGNVPEYAVCEELGIEMIFSIGRGGKVQSSSWLIDAANKKGLGK
ncbi:adenylyltransferase/cytidyltransferase family protein [Candidatus Woesearchaeota archaeon]|nr:adenylyltransferase/cytidyltransferase family protein [Candidatus Woesearchaeota archaeon]